MASKVEIANFALTELGKDSIVALTDNSSMNLIFDDTAREVMSMGQWTSSNFRQTLAQDATAPIFGFAYRYVLPTDPQYLGMISINEDRIGDIEYRISSGYLETDENAVSIRYKGYATNAESWDQHLQRAIVLRLAQKLCFKITGDSRLKEQLRQEFNEALDNGLAVDGLDGTTDSFVVRELGDVR